MSEFEALAASDSLFVILHACFMVGAWVGAASSGILLARYFKQTWRNYKTCNIDQWFHVSDLHKQSESSLNKPLVCYKSDTTQNALFFRRRFWKFNSFAITYWRKRNVFDHNNFQTVHGELPIFSNFCAFGLCRYDRILSYVAVVANKRNIVVSFLILYSHNYFVFFLAASSFYDHHLDADDGRPRTHRPAAGRMDWNRPQPQPSCLYRHSLYW